MKALRQRDIPRGAAAAIVALALLASVVTGRETAPAREPAPPQPKAAAEVPVVAENLDMMKLVRQRRDGSVQDLFAVPGPAPIAPLAPAATPPEAKPEPPQAPSAPALPFSYLGRMQKGERIIIYLLKNQDMLLAETGSTLENVYRVEGISDTAVNFFYLPLGTRQVLSIPIEP